MKIFAGNILNSLRKKNKLTQKELADYLMISRPTYERYEKDFVEIPLSKLCAVAQLFHIEPLDLIKIVITTEKFNTGHKSIVNNEIYRSQQF